uniref:Uncharacterized protein n=1 Tax=Steinernema glaseri TaxID=37863 RepID=A0A1I7ZUK0_9BILA
MNSSPGRPKSVAISAKGWSATSPYLINLHDTCADDVVGSALSGKVTLFLCFDENVRLVPGQGEAVSDKRKLLLVMAAIILYLFVDCFTQKSHTWSRCHVLLSHSTEHKGLERESVNVEFPDAVVLLLFLLQNKYTIKGETLRTETKDLFNARKQLFRDRIFLFPDPELRCLRDREWNLQVLAFARQVERRQ